MLKLASTALVLELVDRQVSGTCVRKDVRVRVSPRAPKLKMRRGGKIGMPACRQAGAYDFEMFFVYIMQSLKTGEFYKGITDNLERRLFQHFNGKSYWSKNRLPLRLVHVEMCVNRSKARDLEKFFKSGYGREIIKEIAN